MIFNNPEDTGVISSSGMGETSVARIATTSHMFSILSSRLYSDKVAAVLREIGCNALDAHIAADTPARPFEVKMPNSLDPTFHIKDWGPGLTEAGVRDLYMTYGESTKQNSNKFVGAMGLGSKSPFAYAHTFTIVAARDGIKRYFTAYLNESRVPVVTKTLECESEPDWPNGLMVTFPVESGDMREFHNKARTIYSWFTVPPVVLGLTEEEKPQFPEFGMLKPGRYGFKPTDLQFARGPAVVMGNIRYPLDMSKIYERYPEFRDVFMTIAEHSVHLFVGIGEVMFTPNREALEYDKSTLETLKNRFVEVVKDIGQTMAEQLATPEVNRVTYLRKLDNLRNEFKSTGLLTRNALPQLLKVCGITLDHIKHDVPDLTGPLLVTATKEVGSQWVNEDHRSDLSPYLSLLLVRKAPTNDNPNRIRTHSVSRGVYYASRSAREKASPVAFEAKHNVAVFHLEGKKDGKGKMQALVASGELDFALLVVPGNGATEEQAKELAERIAGPEGFDGYPVISTKALDLPKERVKQLLNRRTARLTPDERLQRIRVLTLKPGSYHPDESTMYDQVNAGAKYYALTEEMRSYQSSRTLTGNDGKTGHYGMDSAKVSELLSTGQLNAMLKAIGLPGDVKSLVMFRPTALKRVDPEALGLVNLVDMLLELFRDDAVLEKLAAHVDDREVIASALAKVHGWYEPLGRLQSLKSRDQTQLWDAFNARYSGTKVMQAIELMTQLEASSEEEAETETNQVFDGLCTLRQVNFLTDKVTTLFEHVESERASLLLKVHSQLKGSIGLLNWDNLVAEAENSSIDVAMAYIDLSMMMAGIMPVRSLAELPAA